MNIAMLGAVAATQTPRGLGIAALDVALWAVYRRAARPTVADVFFGVTVPADWPDSTDGRAVAAAYRRRVAWASVVAIAMAVGAALVERHTVGHVLLLAGGPLGLSAAATAAYLAGRRAARPHAGPAGTVREASLEADGRPTVGRWVAAQAGPAAVLAASTVLLMRRWPEIPARMAVHFDVAGRADRWAAKSPGAVLSPVAAGALTCGFIFVVGLVMIGSGRRIRAAGRDDRYLSAVLGLTLFGEYLSAVVMAALSWLPAVAGTRAAAVPWWIVMGTTPVAAVAVGYFAVRVWPALKRAAGSGGDGTPDRCWRWGLFYANPDDPAVLVPKRFGFGYTVNFARGGTWVLLVGTAAFVAAVALLPLLTGRR